jgi:hypothetical protein
MSDNTNVEAPNGGRTMPPWLSGKDLPFKLLRSDEFEDFCFAFLRKKHRNCEVVQYGGGGGDKGRDIVVTCAGEAPVIYQCKHYAETVGVGEVRQELAKLFCNVFAKAIPPPERYVFLVSTRLSSHAQDLIGSQNLWQEIAEDALTAHLKSSPSFDLVNFAKQWWPDIKTVPGNELSEHASGYTSIVEKFFRLEKVIVEDVASKIAEDVAKRLLSQLRIDTDPDNSAGGEESVQSDQISARQPTRIAKGMFADRNLRSRELDDAVTLTKEGKKIIVIAPAGMGKSLLLRRMHVAESTRNVLVKLGEFDGLNQHGKEISFAAHIRQLNTQQVSITTATDVPELLLDGLDQLQDHFKPDVVKTVKSAEMWVLTGRRLEDIPYEIRAAAEVIAELLPLSDPQIRSIIDSRLEWRQANALWKLLDGREVLELCRTPLHTYLIIALFSVDEEALPVGEFDLLECLCSALLRRTGLSEHTVPSIGTVDACLMGLSFILTKRGSVFLKKEEIDRGIGPNSLRAVEYAERAGIVVFSRGVRFLHQQFQEYYAARNILSSVDCGSRPDELMEQLPLWTAGWWDEPLRLAAAVKGDAIVSWLISTRPLVAWNVLKRSSGVTDHLLIGRIRDATVRFLPLTDAVHAHHAHRFLDNLDPNWRNGIGTNPEGVPMVEWIALPGCGIHFAKYPITRIQYNAFLLATGLVPVSAGYGSDPAVFVSWDEAIRFCDWLTVKLNRLIRLPTVEEWEAAAGNGTEDYPWGKWRPGICNVAVTGIGSTSPVGAVPAGASYLGAMDMSGNVWEWCMDARGDTRAVKGGSWTSYVHHSTIAFSNFLPRDSHLDEVGFRPCWDNGSPKHDSFSI